MTSLRITTMGGVGAMLDGQPVEGLRSDRVRALLAYLAVEAGRPHARDTLASLVWDVPDLSKARTNLRIGLSNLRQCLGDAAGDDGMLTISRSSVQLHVPPAEVDVHAVQAAIATVRSHQHDDSTTCASCHKSLGDAAELCRGELLDGLGAIGDAFDEWRAVHHQAVNQDTQWVLSTLAAQHLASGDTAAAAECAQRQLLLEPWAEQAHRTLMTALWRDGQRGAAIAQFEQCEQLLRDELGVGPSSETIALRDQVEQDRVSTRAPVNRRHHALPRDLGPFIGRSDEVERLVDSVTSPSTPLVTIVGPGGMGKTRTAVAACRRMLAANTDATRDGLVFIDLTTLAEESAAPAATGHDPAEQVATAIGRGLGMRFTRAGRQTEQVTSYLADRQLVLVLDNVDALARTPVPSYVAALLEDAPGVSILATSRVPLALRAEAVVPLDGLHVPDDPREADTSESVRLFVDRATRAAGAFDLHANRAEVTDACRLVGGTPLAIEMMAARVPDTSCAELVAAVRADLEVLAATQHDVPERQRSMSAVLGWAWRMLTDEQQSLLVRLSVFQAPFTAATARRVVGPLDSLASLVAVALVRFDGDGRYSLHPLVRRYVRAQEVAAAALGIDLTLLDDRHAEVHLHALRTHGTALNTRRSRRAIAELDREREDVLAAWRHAARRARTSELLDALPDLARYLTSVGSLRLLRELLTGTAAALGGAGDAGTLRAELALQLATVDNVIGDAAGALTIASALLPVPAAGPHDLTQLRAAVQMTTAHTLLGNLDDALATADAALAGGARLDEHAKLAVEGDLHHVRGGVLHRFGRFDEAHDEYMSALRCYDAIEDLHGESVVLGGLGTIAKGLGRWDEAADRWGRQLELQRVLGDRPGEAATRVLLGVVAYYAGDYPRAKEHYEEALEVCADIGDRRNEGMARGNLGCVHRQLGNYELARRMHEQALEVKHEIGFREGEAWGLTCLSLICHLQGEDEAARGYRAEALDLYSEMRNRVGEGYGLTHRGHDLLELGDVDGAVDAYGAALERRSGVPHLAAETRAGLARAMLKRGDLDRATELVEEVLAFLDDGTVDGMEQPFRVLLSCVHVLRRNGDARAEPLLQAAVDEMRLRADRLDDHTDSYLTDVPWRRELMELATVNTVS